MKKSLLLSVAVGAVGIIAVVLILLSQYRVAAALVALIVTGVAMLLLHHYSTMRLLKKRTVDELRRELRAVQQEVKALANRPQPQPKTPPELKQVVDATRTTTESLQETRRLINQKVSSEASRVVSASNVRMQRLIALHDALREDLEDLEAVVTRHDQQRTLQGGEPVNEADRTPRSQTNGPLPSRIVGGNQR